MRNNPIPNQIYRHFKGKLYQVISLAIHTETEEEMVVYRALYGSYGVYVRPLAMFMEEVDRKKYPDADQKYRFQEVEEEQEADSSKSPAETLLEVYLDASDCKERLVLLDKMEPFLTKQMLMTMAIINDFELPEGTVEEQAESLRKCLLTRERFEQTRLR